MKKFCLAFIAVVMAGYMSFGIYADADSYTTLNINEQSITITEGGNYHIIGTGEETTNTITVENGVDANIKLDNVNIKTSPDLVAFKIEDNSTGDVNIELVGENSLVSNNAPGICKNGSDDSVGTLTITGSGSLRAENAGTDGAGIGSSNQMDTKNIVINGGTITAIAGKFGAGIGGGGGGGCASDITINGGVVTATGGDSQGAGIGGGSDYSGSRGDATRITITGGTVFATANGRGAGIGGGYGYGSDITITGGKVKATGAEGAADIGGCKSYTNGTGRLVQLVDVIDENGSTATNNIVNALTYSNGQYTVSGNINLDFDLTIKNDEKLIIDEDAVLTVNSSLINNGTFENNGIISEPNGHDPWEDDGDCTTPIMCKACQGIAVPAKTHKLSQVQHDDYYHWYNCENENCTQIIDKQRHKAGEWIIDEKATSDKQGRRHKECVVCNYVMETETIPKDDTIKTGDGSHISLYIALMVAALAGGVVVLRKKKTDI